MELDYLTINKENWNSRVETHFYSDFYNVQDFIKGQNPLNSIELNLLGDVKGKKILHLQCHFGQDTIQLARMGAICTGVDFSEKAIEKAKKLAQTCQEEVAFICADIYSLKEVLTEKYDFVFTSYGTIGWLPDLMRWGDIVSHFLKPQGIFVMADFHPVIWMYNDNWTKIIYDYFKGDPIVEENEGTYAGSNDLVTEKNISWNHSLSELIQALLHNGIRIDAFQEFDYSPYPCFGEMEKVADKIYRLKEIKPRIPMVYAIKGQLTKV